MTTDGEHFEVPTGEPAQAGRVIVGVDGSPESHDALAYAAAVANWRNWTLHIVNVWHVSYPVATLALDVTEIAVAASEAAARTVRDAEKEVLGDGFTGTVVRSAVEGYPARTLIELSRGADLLVLGNRGRGGFSSLALGSVGQACVHHAHCPVLIARPKTKSAAA
jgi:nucleotide-binding universal stress UspA family protein